MYAGQSVFGTGGQDHDPHPKDFAGPHVSLHDMSSDSEMGSIDLGVLFMAQQAILLRSTPCLPVESNTDLGFDSFTTEDDPVFSESDSDSPATGGEYSESETETEDLRRRIAYHRSQGRAKSRRTPWSDKLVNWEFQHWTE